MSIRFESIIHNSRKEENQTSHSWQDQSYYIINMLIRVANILRISLNIRIITNRPARNKLNYLLHEPRTHENIKVNQHCIESRFSKSSDFESR